MKYLALLLVVSLLAATAMPAPVDDAGPPFIACTISPHSVFPPANATLAGSNFPLASSPAIYVVSDHTINVPFGDYTMIPDLDFIGNVTTTAGKTVSLTFSIPAGVFTGFTTLTFQFWQDVPHGSAHEWHGSNGVELAVL